MSFRTKVTNIAHALDSRLREIGTEWKANAGTNDIEYLTRLDEEFDTALEKLRLLMRSPGKARLIITLTQRIEAQRNTFIAKCRKIVDRLAEDRGEMDGGFADIFG